MQPIDPDQVRAFGDRVDFGDTAKDYRNHRQGFPQEFFDAMQHRGIGQPDQQLLDIGTGTGTVALGLARTGAKVTGLDPADALLEQARDQARTQGLDLPFVPGRAERLPFADQSFDIVTAGQCWHWFRRDEATREVFRVLRPNGRVVIAHFDWIPLPGNVVQATEDLILRYNPEWSMGGGCGMYPQWLADLAIGGFTDLSTFSFDLAASYDQAAWRGRIRASAGVGGSLDEPTTERFDADLAALLQEHFPQNPLAVHHRVWAVLATKPNTPPS